MIGIGIILALYIFLAWYITKQLPKLPDEMDRMYAVGLLSLILMQAFINM